MYDINRQIITLIISYTCVGLFVATAIATALDLFNTLKLPAFVRKKLYTVLLIEIAVVGVAAFRGFLNPESVVKKVKAQEIGLQNQITDTTRVAIKTRLEQKQESRFKEVVVEFPWVDTASSPGYYVAASPYLHALGVSSMQMQPSGSALAIVNNLGLYAGHAIKPTTSQNILTQINTNNEAASFTLRFSEPFSSVSFTRPALFPATKSGITHPAWSAHALDATGRELSSQSEELTRSFSDVPARTYTLRAPAFDGISAVRFDSNPRLAGKPFAAFSAVLIERLTMTR